MTERSRAGMRRIGMKRSWVFAGACLAVILAGCGNEDAGPSSAPRATTADAADTCTAPSAEVSAKVAADVDGDGAADVVKYTGAIGDCAPTLGTDSTGSVRVASDLPLRSQDLSTIVIPGHEGAVVLARFSHPRGGFEARLYGVEDGAFSELTIDGDAVVPFVATDAPTSYVSAECTSAGFEITRAEAHQPVGVVPAWDVHSTAYTVDGTTVTAAPEQEVADNVLDEDLAQQYPDLVDNELFENCPAAAG